MMNASGKIEYLLKHGATIPMPSTVHIDGSVKPDRLSPDITIHPGCRITGEATSIGPGCALGEEGPVTLADCQLAGNVTLKGGSFSGAVMMRDVVFGPCAHVRETCLLEEGSACGHGVGLKQTILMPYVIIGSLVNFCDCFMAGGTDRKNHSEVGSSYVHFNYTPHQDKATPSLIGDVPRGVMLDQRPIFLGGQGGLVGPSRIEFGTIIAAGTICRKDILEPGRLVFGPAAHARGEIAYDPVIYGDISRILANNFIYLGNLHALYQWYKHVRCLFITDQFDKHCVEGAVRTLRSMLDERLKRLSGLADNVQRSIQAVRHRHHEILPAGHDIQTAFVRQWPRLAKRLGFDAGARVMADKRKSFVRDMKRTGKHSCIAAVKALTPKAKLTGTLWLQSVVDSVAGQWRRR